MDNPEPNDTIAIATLRNTFECLVSEFEALGQVEQRLLDKEILHFVGAAIWHARTVIAACRIERHEDLLKAHKRFYSEFINAWEGNDQSQ